MFRYLWVAILVSFDMMAAINAGLYNSGATNVAKAPGRIWNMNEKITTAYTKVGLEFNAGIPWHGNFGLQMVRSQQDSTGVFWDPIMKKVLPGQTFAKSYTDVLPSLNLIGNFGPDTFLRVGAAKVLARPNMEDMRAGFTAQVATSGAKFGQWSGGGGNPYLEPWRATQLDISFEKYFSKRSYVGAAAFHKKLKTSIYVDSAPFDFTGFPNSTGITPTSNIGPMAMPINGQGGYIDGVELSATVSLGDISKPLDGFGFMVAQAHNHSNIPGHANDGKKDLKRTLEGLSGETSSLTVFYEKNGWSARYGQRYRSKYIAEVRGVWIDNSLAAINAERIADVQFGYAWESGSLKGLSVQFQINNLNNTPYTTSTQDDSSISTPPNMMPERYNEYGRRYLLGVGYKF